MSEEENFEVTDLEMKAIAEKLEEHDLLLSWVRVKNMIYKYISMEWTNDHLPNSDELLNVCCSVINDPRNEHVKHLTKYLSSNELEIMTACLWKSIDEYFNGKDNKNE